MKNLKWMSLALVAVFAVACDPYEDEKTGTPAILDVVASNSAQGFDATLGTETGGAYTITGITCGNATTHTPPFTVINAGLLDYSVFTIVFDRQFDPFLVQTSTTDCTPVPGTLTITPAPASGQAWYTCYSPGGATPGSGASIAVYQAPAGGSAGWADEDGIETYTYLPPATYTITGNVAGRDVNVTVDAATCAP